MRPDRSAPSRRTVLGGLGAAGASALIPGSGALGQTERLIPQRPSARVIVDNDFAGDPDGLAALAHQLLSPKTRVTLVTASALDPKLAALDPKLAGGLGRTAAAGRDAALELIRRLRLRDAPPIAIGSETFDPGPSPAARAIVAEAMRPDPLPLFVTCGGPPTNVAAALRTEPSIAERMTILWIGGGGYPEGGPEYNLATDAPAARHVIEGTRAPLWQVPQPAYRRMQLSIAEMTADLRPISPFTRWLYERFTTLPSFVDLGGTWPMGDTPLVLLTAISAESSRHRDLTARRIAADLSYGAELPGRTVRVFEELDARLALADMIASFRLHAARALTR